MIRQKVPHHAHIYNRRGQSFDHDSIEAQAKLHPKFVCTVVGGLGSEATCTASIGCKAENRRMLPRLQRSKLVAGPCSLALQCLGEVCPAQPLPVVRTPDKLQNTRLDCFVCKLNAE